ncbi:MULTISPECIES: GlsB/YeaQ/YmgE family stress response membrane protein [Microbacterium]|uniref:GlsB/YeaQ/YmgE family stress response membrane protein n=2 Tax=Microbacterium TaxID=33882 RepID=A0ABR8NK35_9MICO|nr:MULTISPECIES: GlsB/YeaQ/YmgE family stress response membrane protein [Microbacterium]MBD3940544.1 GlsB/YeaQ/YmgE family stress response membrane protein [Microbacterium helvum]TQM25218.1 putative membrane protein YeaQ/YmgE (transglycosylase-associated protein family) [Microbacterium kyungheense]
MLWTILGLIIVGLIAGLIARALIPGKQSMGILLTIVLGIVGSFVGGFLGYLLFGSDPNGGFLQPSGIIGSILGSIIVLGLYVLFTRRRGAVRS